MKVLAFVEDKAVYEWYDDDGMGKDYENPNNIGKITVSAKGAWTCEGRQVRLEVEML